MLSKGNALGLRSGLRTVALWLQSSYGKLASASDCWARGCYGNQEWCDQVREAAAAEIGSATATVRSGVTSVWSFQSSSTQAGSITATGAKETIHF